MLCRVAAGSHDALQETLLAIDRSPSERRSTTVIALSCLVRWRTLRLLRSAATPGARGAAPAPRAAGAS